ncbi:integrase core domain-containing protein [Streptomyces sp. G35A]
MAEFDALLGHRAHMRLTGRRRHAPAFLEHGNRRLHITGITAHPTAQWTTQQTRHLIAGPGARLEPLRFIPRDRHSKYTDSFDAVFGAENMDVLLSAPQAPRMNTHRERVIGTIRHEVLDHVLMVNEVHAHQVLAAYQEHYHTHQPHRSPDQRPPQARKQPAVLHDRVPCGLPRTRVLPGASTSTGTRLEPQRRLYELHK